MAQPEHGDRGQSAMPPVEFSLNHLLCAVQFNVVNLMPASTVTLNVFTLNGLREGKAVITKGKPVVTLSSDTSYGLTENVPDEEKELEYNTPYKLFSNDGGGRLCAAVAAYAGSIRRTDG